MASVRDVTRAVRNSKLTAPARHIVLTLADLADPETGELSEEDSPSLTLLATFTGLGRSTVAEQLNVLEDLKWVERMRPTVVDAWKNKTRTRYCVAVGTSPGAGLVQEADQSRSRTSPGAGPTDQGESDTSTSPEAGLVQEPDTLLVVTPSSGNNPSSPSSKPKAKAKPTEPEREDVEQVCKHLAKWILANGSRKPRITQEWRTEARRMIDLDKRSVRQIMNMIDWCQKDKFWKANILSMPTLREKYDQMRLKALAETEEAEAATQRQAERMATPPSNAPRPVAKNEACPQHPYERASSCGACASERLASKGA